MNEPKQIGTKYIIDLEKARKSKVIVYFTGDRQLSSTQIAEDAVRPLYDHLVNLNFDSKKKDN